MIDLLREVAMLLSLSTAVMAGAEANHRFRVGRVGSGWTWQGVSNVCIFIFAAMADLI